MGSERRCSSPWRTTFLERSALVFQGDERSSREQARIAELERLVGKKEVEIALLENFLGRAR